VRKALFALMLLGASFAGGAAINGPAFEVARTWLMGRTRSLVILTSGQPAPAAAAPADPSPNPDATAEAEPDSILTPAYRKMGLPGRKSPALARKGQASTPEAPKLPTAGLPTVADPNAPEPLAPDALSLSTPPAGTDPAPPPDFGPPLQAAVGLLSDLVAPAPASTPAPPALPVDPAVAPAVLAPEPPSPSGGRAGSRDWSELRRKLRAAGVARYELKAEPEGRAHIACLIPLAGRRAVAQQFEAEGADECAAVEAVLRRIALWKATEGGTP
jgi:hypothetical protein